MLPIEFLRVALFVGFVIGVYVMAASTIARSLLRRFKGIGIEPGRVRRRLGRVSLVLAAMGLPCFAYGYLVEPYWLEVTRVRIESARLPAGTRPIRIVQISDLHCDPQPRLEEQLPDVIAAEHPDLIFFTGDSINSPEGLPVFRRCLSRLSEIAPTFGVRGNWDVGFWGAIDLFEGTGVRELQGEAVSVEVAGTTVWLTGLPIGGRDVAETTVRRACKALPPDQFTVFLYHYPDAIYRVAKQRVDLFCAGHIHGGQVALPFYGALVTFQRTGKQFESGLHRVDQTWIYVNLRQSRYRNGGRGGPPGALLRPARGDGDRSRCQRNLPGAITLHTGIFFSIQTPKGARQRYEHCDA
jgi:uncharacterized protein